MIDRKIPLAWRQLMGQRGRFIVALAGISFADVLILMQLGFQSALLDSNTRLHRKLNADIVLVSRQAQNLGSLNTFSRRRVVQAANLPEIQSAESLYVRLANWRNPQTKLESSILVLGFNPIRPAFDLPELEQNAALIRYPDTLLFDRGSRGPYKETIAQIEQGSPVTTELEGRRISIRGLYRVGSSFVADGNVMTSDQNFLKLFNQRQPGEVSIGLVQLKPGSNPTAVVNTLRSTLPDDVKVLTKQEFIEFERNYWQQSTTIGFIFSFGVVIGFLVGVVIVYQIIYSDVIDHLAEYATLKAIGYRDRYLLKVIFQEALILAVIGFVPGCLIANGMYTLTRNTTNLPLFMTRERVVQVLLLTVSMCSISGAIAIRKLRSADPADIF
ncbi:ABC transporter permease DevC [Leptolyngbya sp. GGD]|uniref:ABC transporter permease DevC n=1 Tax=Leptolyngbya sp. GGD TaxID=2997907 RepID=UPI00227C04AC|nr:ABC transporter permease DevC [Leptolyngbya sp. GGD]MCY6492798.1 ABC transporter permease DevC [Leptolyngbya sp. GGD]